MRSFSEIAAEAAFQGESFGNASLQSAATPSKWLSV
jgi:hypothetical protein